VSLSTFFSSSKGSVIEVTKSLITGSLAVGKSVLTFVELAKTWIPLSIETSVPTEVRLYNNVADQLSDQSRNTTDIPTVSVFQQTTSTGNLVIFSPIRTPFGSNEDPRTNEIPITVWNRSLSTASISISITCLSLEN
jgi:hypothetical protein